MMWKLFIKIKQHFCKHKFVKYYIHGVYVYRCAKCNKVVTKAGES